MKTTYKGFDITINKVDSFVDWLYEYEVSQEHFCLSRDEVYVKNMSQQQLLKEIKDNINEWHKEKKEITKELTDLTSEFLKRLKSKEVVSILKTSKSIESLTQYGFEQGFWK